MCFGRASTTNGVAQGRSVRQRHTLLSVTSYRGRPDAPDFPPRAFGFGGPRLSQHDDDDDGPWRSLRKVWQILALPILKLGHSLVHGLLEAWQNLQQQQVWSLAKPSASNSKLAKAWRMLFEAWQMFCHSLHMHFEGWQSLAHAL